MTRYAALLLALLFVPHAAAAAETDPAPDPFATQRFHRMLDQARIAAAEGPLAVAAITVSSSAATSVGSTTARLNGTLNAGGSALPASAYFNYGLAADALTTTTSTQLIAGNQDTPFSADISALTCATQYFFRAVGKDPGTKAEILGSVLNFTTTACAGPPDVTTSAATAISANGATLNGSVDPNGGATTAVFDYGTSVAFGLTAAANAPGSGNSPVAISAAIAQLACGTQYFFRARASNGSGNTNGNTLNFTTSACPASAPGVVTNAATSIAATTATLNGSIDPNGIATTGKFEFGTSAGSLTREENVVGPIGTGTSPVPVSAPITDLLCGTQYFFRASANNASGTVTGATLSFNTTACIDPPPSVTSNAATAIAQTSATLNGTVDPNGFAATALFRYGTSSGNLNLTANFGPVGSGDAPVLISANLSSLVCNTQYFFRARGTNSGGTADGNILNFTTSNCAAVAATVTTTAATAISASGATLNGSVDPNTFAATAGFQYGPASNQLINDVPLGSVGAGNSAVPIQTAIGALSCNTQYFFRAFGTNAAGTTFGPTLSFNTSVCPAPAPAAVTGVASGVTPVGATLNGTVDPNGSATTVYFDLGTTPALGTTVAYAVLNGTDPVPVALPTSRLLCDTTYYFRVRAVSVGGVSNGSTVSFAAGSCGGTCVIDYPLSCGTGDFWNNSFGGSTNVVTGYYCGLAFPSSNETGPEYTYRFVYPTTVQATVVLSSLTADLDLFVLNSAGGCNGTNCFANASVGGTSSETLTFTALGGKEYYVVVDGYAGATSDYSLQATCTVPPLTPDVTVQAATRVTLTEATLRGTVNPNGAATTVYFDYKLGSSPFFDRTIRFGNVFTGVSSIGVSTDLTGLACGNTYSYRLRGENAAGTEVSTTSTVTTAPCGAAVCKSDFPLNCGTGDSWNNSFSGSTNTIPSYTCNGSGPFTGSGPEYTYFFTPSETVLATVNLTGLAADLDLYALLTPGGICTGANCIAYSRNGSTTSEQINFIANKNQTYNVNVDGFNLATSNYTINATCIIIPIFSSSFE